MFLLTGPLKGRRVLCPSLLDLTSFKQQVMWFFSDSSRLVKWSPVAMALFTGLWEQHRPALPHWPSLPLLGAWWTNGYHPARFPKADHRCWLCEALRGRPALRNRVLSKSHRIVGGLATWPAVFRFSATFGSLLLCDVSISYHRMFSVQTTYWLIKISCLVSDYKAVIDMTALGF